jgi:hypothetical protein
MNPSFLRSRYPSTNPSFNYDYSELFPISSSFAPLSLYPLNSNILRATSTAIPQGDPFQTLELSRFRELDHTQAPSLLPRNPYFETPSNAVCSFSIRTQSSFAHNRQILISQDLVHGDTTTSSREVSSSTPSYPIHQLNTGTPHSKVLEPVHSTQKAPVLGHSSETSRNPALRRRRKCLNLDCDICSEKFTCSRDLK